MKQPKLILLSDLWGKNDNDWIDFYTKRLKHHFDIKYYDCCELGEIDLSDYSEKALHRQFVNGGIEKAIQNLIVFEKEKIDVLAFSVGGSIGWKAALKGMNIRHFIAISATRLRYEVDQFEGDIHLYFGENDVYRPNQNWLNEMNIHFKIIKNASHKMYADERIATVICEKMISLIPKTS